MLIKCAAACFVSNVQDTNLAMVNYKRNAHERPGFVPCTLVSLKTRFLLYVLNQQRPPRFIDEARDPFARF